MKCPRCGLLNPDGTLRCDCGSLIFPPGALEAVPSGQSRGGILIVVGLIVCIVPYFISIGLPIYIVGVGRWMKSHETSKDKATLPVSSFILLVLWYSFILSGPGPF